MPGAFFTLFRAEDGRKKAYTDADLAGFDPGKYLKFKEAMEEIIVLMGAARWYIGGGQPWQMWREHLRQ